MKNIEIEELKDAIEKRIATWKRTQMEVMEKGLRIAEGMGNDVAVQPSMEKRASRIQGATHVLLAMAESMDGANHAITELEAVLSLIRSGGDATACASFAAGTNKVA